MKYNYHTHTYRCSHASGTEEEYILRAIEGGIEYMGFSDHMPLRFSNGNESGYRVPVSAAKEYCSCINKLKDKYKDKIDINVGFEMEYYPEFFDSMLKNAVEYGAEYLILGQHYLKSENNNNPIPSIIKNFNVEDLKTYVSVIVSAIKTGVFTYVAHPDIFNFQGSTSVYCEEMRKICSASREYNIPLEINFLGIREKRNYPNEDFWQVAGEEKSPVTFGFDSHDVLNAYDGDSLGKAKRLVDKYNLNYIGRPQMINLKNF